MFLLIYPTFREVITKLLLHFKHLLLYDMPPCNINTRANTRALICYHFTMADMDER